MTDKLKKCNKCGATKPRDAFHRNGGKAEWDARKATCKVCLRKGEDLALLKAQAIEMWHAEMSLRDIAKAFHRNSRTVAFWLREAGINTGQRSKAHVNWRAKGKPEMYDEIGTLPPDHPMYELDQEMARAKANPRSSANPWPAASSLV